MTSNAKVSGHAIFQKWDMYSIVVRENYMRHAEMTRCVSAMMGTINGPFHVIDIGCGDAWLAATVLKSHPVQRYLGIDLSAGALDDARTRLPIGSGTTDAQFDFVCNDVRSALPAVSSDSANVVLASYSLHHVSQSEKRCLLGEIRRILVPGGMFVWTDIVRQPGHSRAETLHLIEQDMRQNWTALTVDDIDRAVAHINDADFPEDADWMTSTAHECGFASSLPLFRDSLYGCWAFMASENRQMT